MGTLQDTSMRREIIQNFLTVPGIVGVALMGGTSTPYFRGFETESRAEFSLPQQIAIAQNIQQVLETIPEGFNSFEFQFDGYRAYLHKLNRGTTLLVLTLNHLARLTYTQSVRRLLIELQIDQFDPIPEFRSLALDILPPQSFKPSVKPSVEQPYSTGSEPTPSRQPSNPPQPAQTTPLPFQPPVTSPLAGAIDQTSSRQPQPAANGVGSSSTRTPPAYSSAPALSDAAPSLKPDPNQQHPVQDVSPPLAALSTPALSTSALSTEAAAELVAQFDQLANDAAQLEQAKTSVDHLKTDQTASVDLASPAAPDPSASGFSAPNFTSEPVLELAEPETRTASLKDVLAAINRLSQFTSQYLGTLVVSNYWKATCPAEDWLSHFQIERSAQMTFAVQIPSQPLPILTSSQHQHLKKWVAAFLERCTKVMRDFGKIVRQTLTPQELALLFD